jgi:hypothetical protein
MLISMSSINFKDGVFPDRKCPPPSDQMQALSQGMQRQVHTSVSARHMIALYVSSCTVTRARRTRASKQAGSACHAAGAPCQRAAPDAEAGSSLKALPYHRDGMTFLTQIFITICRLHQSRPAVHRHDSNWGCYVQYHSEEPYVM